MRGKEIRGEVNEGVGVSLVEKKEGIVREERIGG